MSEPINISLPPSVDDFDLAIDTGWEYLRSYENVKPGILHGFCSRRF